MPDVNQEHVPWHEEWDARLLGVDEQETAEVPVAADHLSNPEPEGDGRWPKVGADPNTEEQHHPGHNQQHTAQHEDLALHARKKSIASLAPITTSTRPATGFNQVILSTS